MTPRGTVPLQVFKRQETWSEHAERFDRVSGNLLSF